MDKKFLVMSFFNLLGIAFVFFKKVERFFLGKIRFERFWV